MYSHFIHSFHLKSISDFCKQRLETCMGKYSKKKQAFNFLSTLITSTSRFGTESQSPTQQLPSVSRVQTELEVSALQEAIAESQTFGRSNFTCPYLRKSFYRLFWSFFFF